MARRTVREYIVITQHVWLNELGHGVDYLWDGLRFTGRQHALDHGYRVFGHDDFNIGTLVDGRLVAFGFGMRDFGPDRAGDPHGGYDLAEIARHIGVKPPEVDRG